MKHLLEKASFWRRIAMIAMLIMILIRPSFSTESSLRRDLNLNVWFVVDATNSMVAKDVDNNKTRRFEKVESDIRSIVEGIPGAKFGMIIQDYYSYLASPLSSDAEAIVASLGYVKPKNYLDAQPTNLSELLSFSYETISKYQLHNPDRLNVVVFMSDGEDYTEAQLTVPDGYSNALKIAFVLGYGSTKGSPVEQVGIIGADKEDYKPTEIDPNTYVKYFYKDSKIETDSENRVISKINEENLSIVANGLGGDYYHRESGSVPKEIIQKMRKVSSVVKTESPSEINSRAETYWIFAVVLLGLILWEGADLLNRLLLEKETKNA